MKKNSQIQTLIKKLLAIYLFFKNLHQISQREKANDKTEIMVARRICVSPSKTVKCMWRGVDLCVGGCGGICVDVCVCLSMC